MDPREMERYNPFAADQLAGSAEMGAGDLKQPYSSQKPFGSPHQRGAAANEPTEPDRDPSLAQASSRYSTSFPDPFGLDDRPAAASTEGRFVPSVGLREAPQASSRQAQSNRSNSVTFLHRVGDRDEDQPADSLQPRAGQRGARQSGGAFTSFLSRATSVTSSSVTDRVSGAVGSVRSAVDSLSSQIQQAVPSSGNLISSAASTFNPDQQQRAPNQSSSASAGVAGFTDGASKPQQQQSAASYLASRLSSATNQFVGAASGNATASNSSAGQAGQLEGQTATICRQRVVLILDNPGGTDWAQQFTQYRRLISGLAPQSSASLAFTSFLAAQFSSSSASGSQSDDGDLIEQVNFKDVSVLANQSSATAAVYVSGPSATFSSLGSSSSLAAALPINRLALNIVGGGSSSQQQQQMQQQHQQSHYNLLTSAKTIRPEYVVVRQRGREHLGHLKSIVKALDYCSVPMFEPYEVWNVFQDRQQIFAKLLRVQGQLGKENFPLIPQVFCQTHQDLLNYISNSFISLPCLVRTGPLGKGKIRIDNLQMLKDFATIMATSEQSCTIEPFLDVKCDLLVQKLGTSLKLFKGRSARKESLGLGASGGQPAATRDGAADQKQQSSDSDMFGLQQQQQQYQRPSLAGQEQFGRQTASRQTSLGSGTLFGLMPSSASGSQLLRNNSNPLGSSTAHTSNFEKLSEVNARYRQWVEAIIREFDNKIDVFCIKIVVATNDREYIVGLRNCSMEFLGNQENQDEDRRSLVELIISKMNTILPKHQPVSREPSAPINGSLKLSGDSDADTTTTTSNVISSKTLPGRLGSSERATFLSNTNVTSSSQPGLRSGASQERPTQNANQMLNNRNRSVSMNQGEPMRPLNQTEWGQSAMKQSQLSGSSGRPQAYLPRRASDRSDSMLTNNEDFSMSQADSPSSNSRQQSLGQSFFDQTSTALSSFQRQSMSFLRRLDSRTSDQFGAPGGTPPLSAKSDTAFDRVYGGSGQLGNGTPLERSSHGPAGARGPAAASATVPHSTKSQSVDANSDLAQKPGGAHPPPKPPPPPASLVNRQSSLANYSSSSMGQQRAATLSQQRVRSESSGSSANPMTPQNSLSQGCSFSDEQQLPRGGGVTNGAGQQHQRQQQRVVRQNSALSAFEPFDASLRSETYHQGNQQAAAGDIARNRDSGAATSTVGNSAASNLATTGNRRSSGAGKYDTVSMKSGNSNTSDETTTAEDTMNNLKKTFASIFGDKCE